MHNNLRAIISGTKWLAAHQQDEKIKHPNRTVKYSIKVVSTISFSTDILNLITLLPTASFPAEALA